jgi:four helix bundle protein
MAAGVRDLKVWQEAVALGGDVLRATKQVASREIKAYADALIRAANDPAVAIAEAHVRHDAAEERASYIRAKRALAELETLLTIGRHAGVIPSALHTQLSTRIAAVSQRLTSYLVLVDRQVAADGSLSGAVAEGKRWVMGAEER